MASLGNYFWSSFIGFDRFFGQFCGESTTDTDHWRREGRNKGKGSERKCRAKPLTWSVVMGRSFSDRVRTKHLAFVHVLQRRWTEIQVGRAVARIVHLGQKETVKRSLVSHANRGKFVAQAGIAPNSGHKKCLMFSNFANEPITRALRPKSS